MNQSSSLSSLPTTNSRNLEVILRPLRINRHRSERHQIRNRNMRPIERISRRRCKLKHHILRILNLSSGNGDFTADLKPSGRGRDGELGKTGTRQWVQGRELQALSRLHWWYLNVVVDSLNPESSIYLWYICIRCAGVLASEEWDAGSGARLFSVR